MKKELRERKRLKEGENPQKRGLCRCLLRGLRFKRQSREEKQLSGFGVLTLTVERDFL